MIKKSTTYLIIFLTLLFLFGCNGKPPEPEKVTVEICKTSNLLANEWCEKAGTVETREYVKGTEPVDICQIHKEPLPPPPPPPPPIVQLPQKYHVNQLWKKFGYPIYISPFFAKCIFINKSEYPWEKKAEFIDRIVKETKANSIRGFIFIPYPKQTHIPHPLETRIINGVEITKYNIEKINPEWLDTKNKAGELYKVGKYCYDRRLHMRLIVADSSGTTVSARRWNDHWMNPENNWGYQGKPTYWDHHGLLKWIKYGIGNADCTPEEKERYVTNSKYYLWFFDEVIPFLHAEFKDFLTIEMNEIDTGDEGHGFLGRLFHEKYGFPRWRMISSPRGLDWINDKPNVNRYWIPSAHAIQNVGDYVVTMEYLDYPFLGSGDGKGNDWYTGGYEGLRNLIRFALENGRYGFCGNNWLPDNCDFSKIDYRSGETMMEELDRFMEGK